tara:strand:+ start:96 stop:572 length:477 start_codon:yes stop_codon:yes gene_type:complete
MSKVPGYENYTITEEGVITNTISGKVLKESIEAVGYRVVTFYKDKKRKTFKVHRLLALLFIPNSDPLNKVFIDHKNHIRNDNRLCNLQWVTREENAKNASMYKSNTSGIQGVSLTKQGYWIATIAINKKRVRKTFKNKDDAINWRDDMVKLNYTCRFN